MATGSWGTQPYSMLFDVELEKGDQKTFGEKKGDEGTREKESEHEPSWEVETT